MPKLLEKVNKKNKSCSYFYWFEQKFTSLVQEFFQDFWEQTFEIKLLSITNNQNIKQDKISSGETYFAKPVAHLTKNIIYRLNSGLIKIILEGSLGVKNKFSISNLTDFEIYLIEHFVNSLNGEITKILRSPQTIQKRELKSEEIYNITFALMNEKQILTKFAISIPAVFVEPEPVAVIWNEAIASNSISTYMRVRAGSTRLMLNEIKALDVDDIILLEKSQINKMYVVNGNFSYEFKVNPDPSIMLDLDEDEHDTGGDIMSDKNMWDDIQIEVSAEFDKVKMSLGELKQMTTGMVVDLADAFNDKISLLVEDKIVAKGDLVIINDRYGVRLTEIISEPAQGGSPKAMPASAPAPHAEPTQNAEEDFDYSDFEDEGH
ncbi:FliM/FliN family flagellar motor switch protein [bacterium]|nr:FliM/FliN family flagellar motor switch protein [bacterium]